MGINLPEAAKVVNANDNNVQHIMRNKTFVIADFLVNKYCKKVELLVSFFTGRGMLLRYNNFVLVCTKKEKIFFGSSSKKRIGKWSSFQIICIFNDISL